MTSSPTSRAPTSPYNSHLHRPLPEITTLTYKSSKDEFYRARRIASRHYHTIFGQLSDLTAAQGSILHADAEQEKEEKWDLETKVRVLEELRKKVVQHEAEVEAGRQECEAW